MPVGRSWFVFLSLVLVPAVARATDPDRVWATYLGGESINRSDGIAVDGMGNIYVAGYTTSTQFIGTPGTHQPMYAGGGAPDAFLMKFSPDGARQWGTYLGGPDHDYGYGVAADASGNTVVFGWTYSPSGIATDDAVQPSQTPPGPGDGFIVAFDPDGKRKWGTYLGSAVGKDPDDENATRAAAFDKAGNVYVAGHVPGTLPFALPGALKPDFTQAFQDPCDAYLLKFSPAGALLWGTYYGDTGDDRGFGVAVLDPDIVYLSGITNSTTGIATPGAYDTVLGGTSKDGFIVRFNGDGERQWGSYYGGVGPEDNQRIAVTPTGDVYLAGRTSSNSGIATPGAFDGFLDAQGDGYLARFGADGSLQWGTYYGADQLDGLSIDVASDAAGNALLAGSTHSLINLATNNAYQKNNAGQSDYFLAKFGPDGKRKWGTFLGGTLTEETLEGKLVAAPGHDIIYLAGSSNSPGLATPGSDQEVPASGLSVLLVRFTQHELSAACMDQAECKAGTCVDGVCCDTPCGGGVADDCQTCLQAEGAVADGMCTVQSAAVICRPAVSACDVAESCTGDVAECPADEFAPEGAPCADGVCADGECVPDAGTSSTSETSGADTTNGATTGDSTTTDGTTTADTSTGSGTTTAAPTGSSTDTSDTVDPQPTAADGSATASDGTSATGGESGESGGCSCSQGHGSGDIFLLAVALLALPQRRRL